MSELSDSQNSKPKLPSFRCKNILFSRIQNVAYISVILAAQNGGGRD
jgi:hypothetical protein